MTKEEKRAAKREKRSKFLTRMVDEFKKIGFIITVVFCMSIVIWCMTLYTISLVSAESTIIPSVASALQIIVSVAFGIIGTAFTVYCNAATKEKKSLNDNGLVKGSDGAIKKAVTTVGEIVSSVTGSKTSSEDSEDSDEIPISSCENKK